ncbi:MAG TPA: hypothetical protein VE974_11035 [Thermoanaerobaculia bacterium]|nr:hypothetical protein [Thermoanaerobaculia bacterium]
MSRARLIAFLFCGLASLAHRTAAQQHANNERGVKPQQAYAVSDVDVINLFNGNLNVALPVGPTYVAGGNLSYGFKLVYGGNNWDYESREVRIADGPFQQYQRGWMTWSVPIRKLNAGMGWLFSLGRLVSPTESRLGTPYWVYQAPDGSDHHLYPQLHHSANLNVSDVNYSHTGTYMRHTINKSGTAIVSHTLEMGDGTIREFAADGTLRKIYDRFNNAVTITPYPANSAGIPAANQDACGTSYLTWKVADGHRTHYIYLHPTGPEYAAFMKERVCQASLAAFGSASQRADYLFTYSDQVISRQKTDGPEPYDPLDLPSPTVLVPLLTKVSLPSGSSYDMAYDIGMTQQGSAPAAGVRSDTVTSTTVPNQLSNILTHHNPGSYTGSLIEVRTPSRGRYGWQYRIYSFPPDYEHHPVRPEEFQPPTFSAGVGRRTKYVTETAGSTEAADEVWTYSGSALYEHMKTVSINTVLAPDGSSTAHFFSTWTSGYPRERDYGAPFTQRLAQAGDDPNPYKGMYISTRTLLPDGKKRLTYVTYEYDMTAAALDDNRRLKSRLTVFEDGNETTEVYSGFDGLGHYRTTTTSSSDSPVTRVTTTNYNPTTASDGVRIIDPSESWLTENYDFVETKDVHATAGVLSRSRTEACFDPLNGRLLRRRALRGATASEFDLLAVFKDQDASGGSTDGNVSQEEYYGGDLQSLGAGFATCSGNLSNVAPQYRIHHTYQYGSLASTRYEGMNFKALDATIDPPSGLPSSTRDTAGLETVLKYDQLGRLTGVRPAGRAWTEHVYTEASGTTGPSVTSRHCANGVTNCSVNAMAESRAHYDLFGRVMQQRQRILSTADSDEWAATWTEYAKGHKSAVSVVVPAATGARETMPAGTKQTKWIYDTTGRLLEVQQPDDTSFTFAYPSSRRTIRSSMLALAATTWGWVKTAETSDFLGRLTSVIEDFEGANVATTSYEYDAGNRLTSVNKSSAAPRSFVYDGAGLLTSETNPENGTITYFYDARGHARQKRTADCRYDTNFTFDAAERLRRMDVRNMLVADPCTANHWRPMKELLYEDNLSASDRGLGKLRTAVRYNPSPTVGLIKVAETLTYGDGAGRVTRKETSVDRQVYVDDPDSAIHLQKFEQAFAYDALDRPVDHIYPVCTTVPCGEAPYDGTRTAYDDRGPRSLTAGDFSSTGAFTARASLATLDHAANGLRLWTSHANGVLEQVVPDPDGLARPEAITYSGFSRTCTAPTITSGPSSGPVTHGLTKNLTVTASGTGPFSYQWYGTTSSEEESLIPGATSSSFTTPPITAQQSFWVIVTSNCGKVESAHAVLTPEQPLDPPTSLVATRQGTSSVFVQWTATPGAANYRLERRNGGTFSAVATTSSLSYVDSTCGTGSACVYRVRALTAIGAQSAPSNNDLATLIAYLSAGADTRVDYRHFDQLLSAVNAIRAAAGLGELTWAAILPAGTAPPAADGFIRAAHITALRTWMDNALQAHELAVSAYADPVPIWFRFTPIEQLRERTQ